MTAFFVAEVRPRDGLSAEAALDGAPITDNKAAAHTAALRGHIIVNRLPGATADNATQAKFHATIVERVFGGDERI
jgi:hypothetical protein